MRSLLDMREHCLNEVDFPDPYLQAIKQTLYLSLIKLIKILSFVGTLCELWHFRLKLNTQKY